MVAALLGMLAEMARYTAAFPMPHERPEDALRRVRPVLVVLLDESLDAARSDLFFAHAASHRIGLALFGDGAGAPALAARALQRGIPWLEVPADLEAFQRTLTQAATSRWWRSAADRRQETRGPRTSSATERAEDGTLVYLDTDGHRWLVYDRRGTDRRGGDRRSSGSTASVTDTQSGLRIFVRDDGESRRCELDRDEVADHTPAALARQLARATPG
ncbi:MAG TPA: hypothetical protein VM076_20960 [Gemmatimonadaceae bacterium]|nr:hypothetical protein [Gemmatimonadaceae bacterium]